MSDKCPSNKRFIKEPLHPKSHKGFIREYILIAEHALGKYLPNNACVHHHTENQLVICEDHTYHKLIHRRTEAYNNCGKSSWRKCYICKMYDDPNNLVIPKSVNRGRDHATFHKNCMKDKINKNKEKNNEYQRKYRASRRDR